MSEKLVVSIQQPSIPTYRKAFFERLDSKFKLKIFYGFDGVPSDLPKNIDLQYCPLRIFRLGKFEIKWHSAQLKSINKESDISIISWDVQYFSLWLALVKRWVLRKPLILWGHGYSKKNSRFRSIIRNLPAYCADAIILYDYHTAEGLNYVKGLNGKIFVAPNSLDQEKIQEACKMWKNNNDMLEKFKKDHDIADSFNLIYIGRIYPANNLELLIEALSICKKRIKNLKLIIIGGCNAYVDSLKILAIKLRVDKNIIWVGEVYEECQIAPWMISSHLFCYPANIGLSIMHAFGYGKPVIVNDDYASQNPEIWAFNNKINGLAFKKDDVEDFANKILLLYNDSKLLASMSDNAIASVQNKYNTAEMVKGFLEAIEYSLNQRNLDFL